MTTSNEISRQTPIAIRPDHIRFVGLNDFIEFGQGFHLDEEKSHCPSVSRVEKECHFGKILSEKQILLVLFVQRMEPFVHRMVQAKDEITAIANTGGQIG